MDTREVTVAESRSVAAVQGSLHRDSVSVGGVTWHQAQSYCESEGKRLPTEDEWERACRGPAGARYGYAEYYDPRQSARTVSTG